MIVVHATTPWEGKDRQQFISEKLINPRYIVLVTSHSVGESRSEIFLDYASSRMELTCTETVQEIHDKIIAWRNDR